VELSRPLVGSSNSNKFGSVISSYPILVLFRSPPEIPLKSVPPTLVSLQDFKPSLSTMSLILTSIYLSVKLVLSLAANLKLSIGEKVSKSTSSY